MNTLSALWMRPPSHLKAAADEFRAESLALAAPGAVGLSLAWFVVLGDPSFAMTWVPPLIVLLLCLASFGISRIRSGAGAVLLVVTLIGGNAALLWTRPELPGAFFFVAMVFAAGALLGPPASLGAGATCTLLIVLATRDPSVALGTTDAVFSGVLVWFGVVLTWTAAYPTYAALVWAWNSYLDAVRRSEELRDRQGELNRLLTSLNDTCYRLEVANQELARARAAAEEARQLKAEFAANISHELRTPLNLIIGFSEILMSLPVGDGDSGLPPTVRADVDVIYRNAQHLSNLIDDVLDLSQVDAGRMGLTKERASLAAIAGEAISAIARLYEARRLWLTSEVSEALPDVYVDRTRVRQVLINLLNNAARFTASGGATVRAHQEERSLVVEVADTGVGIAPEDIPKVFEEFRQLDGTTRRAHDGSGLGLAICKRFVELHGGTIWARSEIGSGTIFSFTLPLVDNVASAPLRPAWDTWVRLASAEPTSPTVALVCPDPHVARLFERYLDAYRVVAVTREEEAQDLFARSGLEGIILTAHPGADPAERLRVLRSTPRDLPIITCSLPTSASLGESIGVADYLIKPISRERLLDTLGSVARKARTILVVDDDPEMVRLLARMIRSGSRRYRVLRAYGGESALQMLRDQRPDAVILDLVMSDVSGYDVLREMRECPELRDRPVIAVTARGYEEETVAAGSLSITREGGLSVGELMACLRTSLDAITARGSSDRERSGAPAP